MRTFCKEHECEINILKNVFCSLYISPTVQKKSWQDMCSGYRTSLTVNIMSANTLPSTNVVNFKYL